MRKTATTTFAAVYATICYLVMEFLPPPPTPLENNLENLDPSYKTDPDFLAHLNKVQEELLH